MDSDRLGFGLDYFGTPEAQRQAMYAQQAAAWQASTYAGLGALGGGFLSGIAGNSPYPNPLGQPVWGGQQPEYYAAPAKDTGHAKIGKITPKPGYIRDPGNPDLVRVKVKTDYTWPERFILWWNNVEFDKDGVFKV